MQALRSHTHLQATQSNARPKLPNKYDCLTHNDRQKSTGGNSSFAQRGVWSFKKSSSCLEVFVTFDTLEL